MVHVHVHVHMCTRFRVWCLRLENIPANYKISEMKFSINFSIYTHEYYTLLLSYSDTRNYDLRRYGGINLYLYSTCECYFLFEHTFIRFSERDVGYIRRSINGSTLSFLLCSDTFLECMSWAAVTISLSDSCFHTIHICNHIWIFIFAEDNVAVYRWLLLNFQCVPENWSYIFHNSCG